MPQKIIRKSSAVFQVNILYVAHVKSVRFANWLSSEVLMAENMDVLHQMTRTVRHCLNHGILGRLTEY